MQGPTILQIYFTCRLSSEETEKQAESEQRHIWVDCKRKGINGFFLAFGETYVGLFEGAERSVISQIESLIRRNRVAQVTVLREQLVVAPLWTEWYSDGENLLGLDAKHYAKVPGLAQFVANTINARKDD